ncbi:hypothetical protein K2F45_11490 [Sphingobacterium siyangense]|uniref:hypothetical protein n=1 Tax=Sphingobacterium siyangense TaxID=459529 RepID=UPI00200F7291|nr:hypothetical protein [Sphingobacterium siyangense]UQA77559.1 hypothetical protein K2F45_11490 [Sphingobacterium siyangense]
MKTIAKMMFMFMFIGLVNKMQAQTKEETVKWLREKMTKECFLENDKLNRKVRILAVKLDDNFLMIDVEIKKEKDDNFGKAGRALHQVSVDLTHLDLDFITRYGGLATNGKYVEVSEGPLNKGLLASYYFFRINPSCEPDIINRFRRSIEHYLSLIPARKGNEIF